MIKIEDLKGKKLNEIEGLEINCYSPIREKENLINSIVDIVVKSDDDGILHVNHVKKEVVFTSMVIVLYTNIDITNDDYFNYDVVHENGLYQSIIEKINEDDFYCLDCLYESIIENKLRENSIEHTLIKKSNNIVSILDNMFKHLNSMLDKGDPNVISKHLNDVFNALIKKMPDMSKLDAMTILKGLKKNGIK